MPSPLPHGLEEPRPLWGANHSSELLASQPGAWLVPLGGWIKGRFAGRIEASVELWKEPGLRMCAWGVLGERGVGR